LRNSVVKYELALDRDFITPYITLIRKNKMFDVAVDENLKVVKVLPSIWPALKEKFDQCIALAKQYKMKYDPRANEVVLDTEDGPVVQKIKNRIIDAVQKEFEEKMEKIIVDIVDLLTVRAEALGDLHTVNKIAWQGHDQAASTKSESVQQTELSTEGLVNLYLSHFMPYPGVSISLTRLFKVKDSGTENSQKNKAEYPFKQFQYEIFIQKPRDS